MRMSQGAATAQHGRAFGLWVETAGATIKGRSARVAQRLKAKLDRVWAFSLVGQVIAHGALIDAHQSGGLSL